MSLEAIKQVEQTEAETKQRKAEAAAAAKKRIADAEQAGQEALRSAAQSRLDEAAALIVRRVVSI